MKTEKPFYTVRLIVEVRVQADTADEAACLAEENLSVYERAKEYDQMSLTNIETTSARREATSVFIEKPRVQA